MTTPGSRLRQREADEVTRSAADASKYADLVIHDLHRYSQPPSDTPYSLEFCAHLLGNLEGKTVVDYGCGAGENSVLLAMRKARVIGMDISPDLISLANKRMALNGVRADYEFRVGSCYETGIPDHSVDGVLGVAILHHLELELAAREIRRILKPGGFVVLQEPVRDSALARIVRRLFPAKGNDISPHEHPLTSAELMSVVSGMEIVTVRKFRLPHLVFLSGYAAHRIDCRLLRALPFLSRYASVCVVKAISN
jgi:SAM-dependent methyltransferase